MTCPLCDPEGYRLAMWSHAENHEEMGSDPEQCDEVDCPYWPDMTECDCGTVEALG